jgi:replicative DNA helicase Mcm
LFSGVRKNLDGIVLRGNIHIVLIGDPGIAKSQLLRTAIQLSPRGVFTSGKTSSAAGLTAAAVKDPLNDGWTLEGGAAVMASGGILAVDEIGQIREEDKSALHEVMEQGTVSIAKAGIVSKLQADCGFWSEGFRKTLEDGPIRKSIQFQRIRMRMLI